jgi:hypothetical protein
MTIGGLPLNGFSKGRIILIFGSGPSKTPDGAEE